MKASKGSCCLSCIRPTTLLQGTINDGQRHSDLPLSRQLRSTDPRLSPHLSGRRLVQCGAQLMKTLKAGTTHHALVLNVFSTLDHHTVRDMDA